MRDINLEDITITALSKPRQAAYRAKTDIGWTPLVRLKDIRGNRLLIPDGKAFTEMEEKFKSLCYAAAGQHLKEGILNETFKTPTRSVKSCREMMELFETRENRDTHGNAFKEFFAEMLISKVNRRSAGAFVTWLLEKYERREQTVKHKVHAASALFRWMRRNDMWIADNPFSDTLSGIKYAERIELKDSIEPDELQAIWAALDAPEFNEVRILFEILYCCGMRPSEAARLQWSDIDPDHLVLTYRRTKRKNKAADRRRIPIPARLVAFLVNENATSGPFLHVKVNHADRIFKRAAEAAHVDGLKLSTLRKDWALRASLAGATADEINLYQGRSEGTLEKHYLTNKYFIEKKCRPLIDAMFKPELKAVK